MMDVFIEDMDNIMFVLFLQSIPFFERLENYHGWMVGRQKWRMLDAYVLSDLNRGTTVRSERHLRWRHCLHPRRGGLG